MATTPRTPVGREIDYPTSDGKRMAETDFHRQIMVDLIETLKARFAADPRTYVWGDLLLFYEEGNRRKHVAPDVFVVQGVVKRMRPHYLLWQEGRGPDVVIEVTSKTTRKEEQNKKLELYRDVLKIPEYFLFDPFEDYLRPSFQGHRLVEERYEAIAPVEGRLPGAVLGLHLERAGTELRLYDPVAGCWLSTPVELAAQAEAERFRAELERREMTMTLRESEAARQLAEAARLRAEAAHLLAQAEVERLRQELEAARRRPPEQG